MSEAPKHFKLTMASRRAAFCGDTSLIATLSSFLRFGQFYLRMLSAMVQGVSEVGFVEINTTARQETYDLVVGEYDLVVGTGAAGVGSGHGRRTVLGVPRRLQLLRCAADRQRVDAVRIAVTVAVVTMDTSVTRRPHVDDALSTSTLVSHRINMFITYLLH